MDAMGVAYVRFAREHRAHFEVLADPRRSCIIFSATYTVAMSRSLPGQNPALKAIQSQHLSCLMEPPPSNDGNPENSPTLTMGATAAGTVLALSPGPAVHHHSRDLEQRRGGRFHGASGGRYNAAKALMHLRAFNPENQPA
jgi:hypothetical protein